MTSHALNEFWRYRELFFFMVWRDIKVRYKQTVLGALWAIIQPFFTMIIFTLFFGRLAGIEAPGGVAYPVFSYTGLVLWTFFAMSINMSGNSLIQNSDLLTKVYFPRAILPASAVLSGIVDFVLASVVMLGMMVYYDVPLTVNLLLWPFFVIPLAILAVGVGMILSALNVRYRDIKYVIPFGVQMWLFLTPIIYPTSLVPEKYRFLLALNPVTGVIDASRACVFNQPADWRSFGMSIAITTVLFVVGAVYFTKTERRFADII